VGYLCYFAELHAGISSPVAFGFGCAAGVTGMLYGLFVFKEYQGAIHGATRLKTLLLLLALTLNPLSIATNAASRRFQFSSVKLCDGMTNPIRGARNLISIVSASMAAPRTNDESGLQYTIQCDGPDLPLRMPIATYAELSELPAPLLKAVADREIPPLEKYAAPLVLAGRDLAIVGAAPRGDEQVAPIMLALIGMLALDTRPPPSTVDPKASTAKCQPRALVLTPTRKLATYASDAARTLAHGTSVRCALACGGVPIDASVSACEPSAGLVVATPGRLHDLLERGSISLRAVRYLVLIGADATFDGGYDAHLPRVVLDEGLPLPAERQTIVTCAALTAPLRRVTPFLFKGGVLGHVQLTAAQPWIAQAFTPLVRQGVAFCDETRWHETGKQPVLAALLRAGKDSSGALPAPATALVPPPSSAAAAPPAAPPSSSSGGSGGSASAVASIHIHTTASAPPPTVPCLSLVFVGSRRQCEAVEYFLKEEGFPVAAIATDRPKRAEKDALLARLASGSARVLVATDTALGSLADEIAQLGPIGNVISFDLPSSMAEYAQRLSLTGRGGHSGRKTTIVTDASSRALISELAVLLQRTGNEVPRWLEWMAIESGVGVVPAA